MSTIGQQQILKQQHNRKRGSARLVIKQQVVLGWSGSSPWLCEHTQDTNLAMPSTLRLCTVSKMHTAVCEALFHRKRG